MITINSLKDKSFGELYISFKDAFADYEMQLEQDELERMLIRRGFVPELSFGAFDQNKLVAFTFNGIGDFNGVKTAYDTGTGTMRDYRAKGLAKQIFNYSIPHLKNAGVKQYLLEVLQHNDKAVPLYKKLGFKVTREFNYFSQENDKVKISSKKWDPNYAVKAIDLEQITSFKCFFDFCPAWQNDFNSIFRKPEEFSALAAYHDNDPVGICVSEIKSGDITLIAVDKNHRRKGIATMLMGEIMKLNQYNSVKCINTEITCNSITKFMESLSIPLAGKQFEMIKKLDA